MKRIAICLFLALLCCSTALADVILEPNNAFYLAHESEMTYETRSYEANSPDGWVRAMSAPDSHITKQTLTNGTVFYVSWLFNDGTDTWGYNESYDAWINLKDCLVVYDFISFEEEHGSEFVEHETDLKMSDYLDGATKSTIAFYPYPGGKVSYTDEYDVEHLTFYRTWTDENGLLWGYVGYYMGHRNNWICLSDPGNDALPQRDVTNHEITRYPAQEPSPLSQFDGTVIVVSALVLGVAVVTAILIVARKKRPHDAE